MYDNVPWHMWPLRFDGQTRHVLLAQIRDRESALRWLCVVEDMLPDIVLDEANHDGSEAIWNLCPLFRAIMPPRTDKPTAAAFRAEG